MPGWEGVNARRGPKFSNGDLSTTAPLLNRGRLSTSWPHPIHHLAVGTSPVPARGVQTPVPGSNEYMSPNGAAHRSAVTRRVSAELTGPATICSAQCNVRVGFARPVKGTKLHFKSPTAERRHVLCVGVGGDRTHAARPQGSRVCPT
jgi:hypothetical protein